MRTTVGMPANRAASVLEYVVTPSMERSVTTVSPSSTQALATSMAVCRNPPELLRKSKMTPAGFCATTSRWIALNARAVSVLKLRMCM